MGAAASVPFVFSFVFPPVCAFPNCNTLLTVDNCVDAVILVELTRLKRERIGEVEAAASAHLYLYVYL